MELWIRSQNKMGLYQIENIYIHEDEDKTIHIWADAKTKYLQYYLGGYKTKERALEVLDEIQNKINDYASELYACKNIYVGDISYPTYIYEMPES